MRHAYSGSIEGQVEKSLYSKFTVHEERSGKAIWCQMMEGPCMLGQRICILVYVQLRNTKLFWLILLLDDDG